MTRWGGLVVPLTCAVSGVAWAALAAWRAREHPARTAARALLGGLAAFGLAYAAYDLAAIAGFDVRWERLAGGDLDALAVAAFIGLTEEGAKLAGILLVFDGRSRSAGVFAAAMGVAAGFAALEGVLVLRGAAPFPAALARAALGPVAHATLAVPLALAVAARRSGRCAWALHLIALAAAAALHGGADLSLVTAQGGRVMHAALLLGPALWMFARSRRLAASRSAAATALR